MSLKYVFRLAFFVSLLTFFVFIGVKAAVTLVSFTATPDEDSILIEWETATELDNAGFIVARGENPHPPYLEISPFILARGSGAVGANYEYLDEEVSDGITYYYMLEAWDNNNQFEYHGPISSTIGGPPTNTPTPTATATSTNNPNRTTTPTRTLRPTNTRRPTNTFTPAPPTFTPTLTTNTPTITPTATITPSPTLYDPPEIILNLPETEIPIPTLAATAITQPSPASTQEPESLFANLVESGSLPTIGAICLVVLIWAGIAVGVFIYFQKRNS